MTDQPEGRTVTQELYERVQIYFGINGTGHHKHTAPPCEFCQGLADSLASYVREQHAAGFAEGRGVLGDEMELEQQIGCLSAVIKTVRENGDTATLCPEDPDAWFYCLNESEGLLNNLRTLLQGQSK